MQVTVKDLIQALQHQNPESLVILSSDAEGNKFSPCCVDFGIGTYLPDSPYSGDFYDQSENIEGALAVVLYPKN